MFTSIPQPVLDFLYRTFASANDKVTTTLSRQPSMHEETLDHILVCELAATPPTFFAQERVSVLLETHWLGARRMFGRWEIADIAFFVILRRAGGLMLRKVALLQTKRLYSDELHGAELDDADYSIGIGRLADRTEATVPLTNQRIFGFKETSLYAAMLAGSEQVQHIDTYMKTRGTPVYYGLYNPPSLPFSGRYPETSTTVNKPLVNALGYRVLSAVDAHRALSKLKPGKSPMFKQLKRRKSVAARDPFWSNGWRLEDFVVREVMRCREGRLFQDHQDPNLRALLYERSAPITAAISVTIDFDERSAPG